jgi:hypothetical protein
MTLLIRELERVDSRVLGALRCVDASTRAQVEAPLQVQIAGARVRRNGSGLFVIVQADALAAHEAAFDAPPGTPAAGSVALQATVSDPSGRYLARRVALALPRDPAPTHAAQPGSLFRLIEVPLFPSPAAPTGLNWSLLRLSLRENASGDALGGALVIARANDQVLARALSDWRGEVLLPVPGVPVTTWSNDPDAVVVTELAAQLDWIFDPAAGTRTPAAQVRAGRPPAVLPLVDPDALEAQQAGLPHASQAVALASGRSQTLSLPLALP